MLYQAMLIGYFVARFMFTDILDYCSLIHTCRTDKIAFAPEMTIPKLMLKIRELLEYHQTAFSFQVAHDLGNTILGRNFDTHMYMINTRIRFQYLIRLYSHNFRKIEPISFRYLP